MPEVRTAWRASTASNHPHRRGRPIGAEFTAALADQPADLVVEFGQEWAAPTRVV
jgi:hypothetical protein